MTFVFWFFLCVIFMSSAELTLLMKSAAAFGFFTTFALCALTGIVGGSIVRYQGLQTILSIQRSLSKGSLPATEIVSGLILLIMGALLIVPGFITDTIGMLLLIPPLRSLTARFLISYFSRQIATSPRHDIHFPQDGGSMEQENRGNRGGDIIDVEFRESDDSRRRNDH